MIASMTGFARCEASVPEGSLVCELRSVNHRFLEASLRLPEELRALDPELRARLQKELRRGKVDCTFTYRTATQPDRPMELDAGMVERLQQVMARLAEVARPSGAAPQVNLMDLLRYPGVLHEAAADPDALLAAGRELFGRALTELKAMRAREGARLKELMAQRCAQLAIHVEQVRARLPEVQAAIRTRYSERIAELGVAADGERLEQELALLSQKMDVAEELDRLEGHITETRSILDAAEAAGRRLDFLMQEFNREANTLSSKSQDLATTRTAVDMKVLIEQMREQVQNIE
jgi:uncharacterized protein (TIGR00255 family)